MGKLRHGDDEPKAAAPAVAGAEEEDDDDEEEEEEEEEMDDCFFESLDRVQSGVSIDFNAVSSSSDDDVRFSFASAAGGPPSFRRISISDDEDDDDDVPSPGGGCFDYNIWMSEAVSIDERRRRLLQGFTSSKDMINPPPPPVGGPAAGIGEKNGHGSLKLSRSRLSRRVSSPSPTPFPLPSIAAAAPRTARSFSPHGVFTRSTSEAGRRIQPVPAVLRRSSSSPPYLLSGGGSSPEDASVRIKNLDNGKEFVVSDKEGTVGNLNDAQTGISLSLEDFERILGHSPIVKELMRRMNLRGISGRDKHQEGGKSSKSSGPPPRRKGGWLRNIKFVASSVTGLISEKDRDGMSNSKSLSAGSAGNEWMKVGRHGKSHKELTGLYMWQEIHAHQGSIWCMEFSSDSSYLASAGEDRVVRVWQVIESDNFSSSSSSSSTALSRQNSSARLPPLPPGSGTPNQSAPPSKRTKKAKGSASRRRALPDYIVVPETVLMLSEKPICSFEGHLDDVLDLSWSQSQYLLSSSMDKTVRLWDMESKSCLKMFAHNDYVTCIQFNPVDDRYFISGSLDAKVRIWSIPDRQVVDWSDLNEMVTAVCYTPDGQGAFAGSHKGTLRLYNTTDCKLNQESHIELRNKKNKSHAKKITGFQFAPGNPSTVLITSADSRIRIFDGAGMTRKFRGFRNTSSQISASFTSDGKYVVCASEDSHVYIWKRDPVRNGGSGGKSKGTTRSHEHFYCKDVSVAIPWPNCGSNRLPSSSERYSSQRLEQTDLQQSVSCPEENFPSSRSHCPPLPKKGSSDNLLLSPEHHCNPSQSASGVGCSSRSSSSISASSASSSFSLSRGLSSGGSNRSNNPESASAWGLVVVTASSAGDIKIYQNLACPFDLVGKLICFRVLNEDL